MGPEVDCVAVMVGVGDGVMMGVDVAADVEASAISSSLMSISVEVEMLGSEVRAATAAASVVVACIISDAPRGAESAAERDDIEVGGGGAEEVFLVEHLDVAGRLGHERESCPTVLHHGQALSEPGQEAMALKPSMSMKGGAESDVPMSESLMTIFHQLVVRGRPLTVCGARATTSPY